MPATAGRVKMPVSFPLLCPPVQESAKLTDKFETLLCVPECNDLDSPDLQANNRQHSSTALRTTDMWSNVIGDAFGKANDVAQVPPRFLRLLFPAPAFIAAASR